LWAPLSPSIIYEMRRVGYRTPPVGNGEWGRFISLGNVA